MKGLVVRGNRMKTAAGLLGITTAIFAVSLLMNLGHIGVNAAIHWDARTMVCAEDPMPDQAALLQAKAHVFDAAMGAADPDAATYYFNHNPIPNSHGPLETVRRYYTQVATAFARNLYVLGTRWTGSPTGGILFFQLGAGIAVAVALGIVTTIGVTAGPSTRSNPKAGLLLALFLLAVIGEPVMLSLSRQMLTEPLGFVFLAAAWGTVAWFYRPNTSTVARLVLSVVGAGLFFLTVRTRFNLAVTAMAVTPLVIALFVSPADVRRRWGSYVGGVAAAGVTLAVLVAMDVRAYGPFISPLEYQHLMVKSTWLFFHVKPPFDQFLTALYVNGPLLMLPVLLIGGGLVVHILSVRDRAKRLRSAGRHEAVLVCATIAIAGLSYLLAKTGAQQVGFQPRHLFPFSAGFVSVALLAFPRIRWRWFTALPFAAFCLLVIGANIFSTTGPQHTTMAEEFPPVFTAIIRQRKTEPNPPRLWKDLLAGYYDWADNRRLHDSLVVLQFAREHPSANGHKSLLVVDDNTEGGWWILQTAVEFHQPVRDWTGDFSGGQPEATVQIDKALLAGETVLLVCHKGQFPHEFPLRATRAQTGLDVTDLWCLDPKKIPSPAPIFGTGIRASDSGLND